MVLTDKQKAVIENDFNEKGWNAYKIWKEHPSFECSRMAIHNIASYLKHLFDDLIPAVEAIYLNKDLTFVRDSAPSHRANEAQKIESDIEV